MQSMEKPYKLMMVIYQCPKCKKFSANKLKHYYQEEISTYEKLNKEARKLNIKCLFCGEKDFNVSKFIYEEMDRGNQELQKLNNSMIYQLQYK